MKAPNAIVASLSAAALPLLTAWANAAAMMVVSLIGGTIAFFVLAWRARSWRGFGEMFLVNLVGTAVAAGTATAIVTKLR